MAKYYLDYAGSGAHEEIIANNDLDAQQRAIDMLARANEIDPADVVEGDEWCADGVNDDGEPQERILFWASEDDAENDNGAKSIGQLSRSAR